MSSILYTVRRCTNFGMLSVPKLHSARFVRFSNGPAAEQSVESARPKAVGVEMAKKKKGVLRFVIIGGVAVGLLAVGFQNEFSWEKASNKFRELLGAMTDPETGDPPIEDLQRALGPSPPAGYLSVIIAADDVLVHREWNRNYGWLYEPRAGIKELLRSLVDPANPVMVTLWSDNNASVAAEMTEKLVHEVGGPPAHTPPLSLEHMFLRQGPKGEKRKEKRLECLNRDLRSVLLIDRDPVSEQLNPSNTVLVTSMAEGLGSADTTCAAIRAVVQRVKDDTALSGAVNVPRTLQNLRQEAELAGFSTDATGLHTYLLEKAEEELSREKQRKEAGLGGLMRRTAQSSSVLRSKLTTTEAAVLKEFRDPAAELGPDALLAVKVREATARMFNR